MKKYTFTKFVELSIEEGKKEKCIHENGLDLFDFLETYNKINIILLNSIYGVSTANIINDFISDSIYDELEQNKDNYIIYDDKDNIIADCSNIDNLFDYSESERLRLISEKYSYEMNKPMTDEERLNMIKQIFIQ